MTLDPYSRSAKALGLIGKDAADEVTLFELRHMNAIGDLVEEENIDCDFCVTQVTDVCLYENGATGQQENLEKLAAAGVTGVDDVTYSEGKAAEEVRSSIEVHKVHCTEHSLAIRNQRCERLPQSYRWPPLPIQARLRSAAKSGRERRQFTNEYSSPVCIKSGRFKR